MERVKFSKRLLIAVIAVSLTIGWESGPAFAKKKSEKDYPAVRKMILLPGRPMTMALSPDGRRLAVLHPKGLSLVDLESQSILETLPAPPATDFPEVLFNPEGTELYFSNQDSDVLRAQIVTGTMGLKLETLISLREQQSEKPGIGGLALSPNGRYLVIALKRASQLKIWDLVLPLRNVATLGVQSPEGMDFSRDGLELFVGQGCLEGNPVSSSSSIAVGDKRLGTSKDGFVSIIDLKQGKVREKIAVGTHTGRLCLSKDGTRLFVVGAVGNSVTCVNTETEELAEVISLDPVGGTRSVAVPGSICLAPDGKRLLAAMADASRIVIVALGSPSSKSLKSDPSRVEGMIPVPGKPQAVVFNHEGARLLVALSEPVDWSGLQPQAVQGPGAIAVIDLPTTRQWAAWLGDFRKSHP